MDRFNVSDKFYHELSMVQPTIPRSHRIKRVRSELNQSLKTKMYRVPGPNHGVYCSLTERLRKELEVIIITGSSEDPECHDILATTLEPLLQEIKLLMESQIIEHKARTIEDIESCAGNSRESYSVKYCPLLPIDLDHVVPDELHWFLRVIDVLLENVVLQIVQLDVKVNKKQADSLQGAMLQKLSRRVVYHFRFGERTLVHLHWIGHH
ncbi:hypothetical protein EMCRGX_G023409 [Ephydatia muelleri]